MKLTLVEINTLSAVVQQRSLPHDFILRTAAPMLGADARIVLDILLGINNKRATYKHRKCAEDYENWLSSLKLRRGVPPKKRTHPWRVFVSARPKDARSKSLPAQSARMGISL